jgi:hypothetical protein
VVEAGSSPKSSSVSVPEYSVQPLSISSTGSSWVTQAGGLAKDRVERDEEDLVRLYLTDIGQYPLLTKDDEVRLAKQIEAGKRRAELDELEAGARGSPLPASASCAASPAKGETPSARSCSPTSVSWSRSPRSTRPRACRCSTSSRRATWA